MEHKKRAVRMDSAVRERMIVQKAVEYFAEHGFESGTRNLAKHIGVTQSLLYRYFPNKEGLINQVYEEVYLAKWNPAWETLLQDRSISYETRLKTYYLEYAQVVLSDHWVRILVFAGLKQEGLNNRLFKLLRKHIFAKVIHEFHHAYTVPELQSTEKKEIELEMVWALHAAIFYIGMRKSVYQSGIPKNVNLVIETLVENFIVSLKHYTKLNAPQNDIQKKAKNKK